MASASDLRDILDIRGSETKVTKASLLKEKDSEKKKVKQTFKRPEGMHRELYALLYSDNMDKPPMLPTDNIQTYQTAKAKLGCKVVRPWQWVGFTNPARSDGAVFHHWQRVEDEGKDYKFAKFNKTVQIPSYSEQEYKQYLFSPDWTPEETAHLFDLANKFDLRWHVMFDRYEHNQFSTEKVRTLEDLKERYYHICNRIAKVRKQPGETATKIVYDADHERRRRLQLNRLLSRTEAQVEEEAILVQELKKIEARKKEREKKSQDLQKLIAFDSSIEGSKKVEKRSKKKSDKSKRDHQEDKPSDSFGIRFPDYKSAGVMLRSQMMKLPSNLSQRRIKSLELLLNELKLESNPMPTETVVQLFNKLRSDMVYLYDLKVAYANYEMDLQSLSYKWDALAPGQAPPIHSIKKRVKGSKKLITSNLDIIGKERDNVIDICESPKLFTNA